MDNLQDTYAPANRCFGCGPSNPKGLRIKSPVEGEEVVCRWKAQPHHLAYEGAVSGGICGTILDCHSNWAAAWHLMRKAGATAPPCTVTAEFHVRLRKPTPLEAELELRARIVESTDDRATVETTLTANGVLTATCRGLFVAVREGHPAFHRW
jgi:acyl-coenzyme A thioesterase PaaI-like protein